MKRLAFAMIIVMVLITGCSKNRTEEMTHETLLGTLSLVDSMTGVVTITTGSDTKSSFSVDPNVAVILDGNVAKMTDLKEGQSVRLEMTNAVIKKIDAKTPVESPAVTADDENTASTENADDQSDTTTMDESEDGDTATESNESEMAAGEQEKAAAPTGSAAPKTE